jgi:hypothetical protein
LVESLDGDGSLADIGPQPGICSAAVFSEVTVVASMLSALERPSELQPEIRRHLGRRRVVLHAMHSVVDWFAFAIWEDDKLIRALSLSPDTGIIENVGVPLPVESPFWDGQHALDYVEYALPFHPLELGEEVLADQFGFILEGVPREDLYDPSDKPLFVFNVDDDLSGT